MGRGVHCTSEERQLIKRLRQQGKTYKEISESIGCSQNMVTNAIRFHNQPETRGRKRATTIRDDRNIQRMVRINPFVGSSAIRAQLCLQITDRTVRNRLLSHGLPARTSRKVPFISSKNRKARKAFALRYADWVGPNGTKKWRNILWTDESKMNLFGSDGRHYVRRPPNQAFSPRFTRVTMKHGGGSIMVWGCFSWYGVGPIHWIKDIMDQHVYVDILQNIMLPYVDENMPLIWTFQQDNDPKHTSKLAKNWFIRNNITVLNWPAQSPDLNPIENLWSDVKRRISGRKCTSKEDLWKCVEAAWYETSPETCKTLVDSMTRTCSAVLKNGGFTTKY